MDDFLHDPLMIRATTSGTAVHLAWVGRSKDRQPSVLLTPYLGRAIDCAAERKVPLEMRFEGLEFFNSATVMVLVQAIHAAKTRAVPLRFLYAAKVEWQRLSFEPMRIFEGGGAFEVVAVGAIATERGAGPS